MSTLKTGARSQLTEPHSQDELGARLSEIFTLLGLKQNERRVLAALVLSGRDVGAEELADQTGIRIDEVYENLSRLVNKGLVSYTFSNHKRYLAGSFSEVADHLLSTQMDELTVLKKKAGAWQTAVGAMREEAKPDSAAGGDDRLRIHIGKERILNKLSSLARNSKAISLVVTNTTFRFIAHSEIFADLENLPAGNVSIVVPSSIVASWISERLPTASVQVVERLNECMASFALTDSEILVIPSQADGKPYGISSSNLPFVLSFSMYHECLLGRAKDPEILTVEPKNP